MKDQITMLVNSCDKNSFLWEPFAGMFHIHWDKEIDIEKYILSETESADIDGFEFILGGKNSWSTNVLYALDQIKTKYVFWWIEDFFMRNMMLKQSFEGFLYFLEKYNADKLVVHYPHAELKLIPQELEYNLYRMAQDSPYTTTLQPSIWNVEHFKSCLIDGENPWQFELGGSERLNKRNHNILLYMISGLDHERWHNEALHRGEKTDHYYRLLKQFNLEHLIQEDNT